MKNECPFTKDCEWYKALKKLAGRNIICYDNYVLCPIYKMRSMKREFIIFS